MYPAQTVLLVVIGSPERLRSSALRTLTSHLTRHIYVDPVLVTVGDRIARSVDDQQSELLYGRQLSDRELGCAIAHRNAISQANQELSRDNTLEWALIVEDDAKLDLTTFKRIEAELIGAARSSPSLVSFYSVHEFVASQGMCSVDATRTLKAYRYWFAGAVCYAVNQRGLAEIHRFSAQPITCVADWPLHYSRLKFFKSVYTRVSEVEGGSTIGYRPRLGVGNRLVLHIRQIRHIRRITANHGVTVVDAVGQLIVFPAWRDSKARLESIAKHFRLGLVRLAQKSNPLRRVP